MLSHQDKQKREPRSAKFDGYTLQSMTYVHHKSRSSDLGKFVGIRIPSSREALTK